MLGVSGDLLVLLLEGFEVVQSAVGGFKLHVVEPGHFVSTEYRCQEVGN